MKPCVVTVQHTECCNCPSVADWTEESPALRGEMWTYLVDTQLNCIAGTITSVQCVALLYNIVNCGLVQPSEEQWDTELEKTNFNNSAELYFFFSVLWIFFAGFPQN